MTIAASTTASTRLCPLIWARVNCFFDMRNVCAESMPRSPANAKSVGRMMLEL